MKAIFRTSALAILIFNGELLLCMQARTENDEMRIVEIDDQIRVENAYLALVQDRCKRAFLEYLISSGEIKCKMEKLQKEREKLNKEIQPKL